jgi:small subunit ribosomal protein S18
MEPRSFSSRFSKDNKKKPFDKNARGAKKGEKKYGASDRGSRAPRKRMRRVLPPMDYKDTEALGKYITEKGKILPRRITRLSSKDQRTLTRLIKRARHSGLLAFQAN